MIDLHSVYSLYVLQL